MAFTFTIKIPVAGPYPSGIKINNGAGYAAGTTAVLTCDDVYATAGDARDVFFVTQEVWAKNTSKTTNPVEFLGTTTNVTATNVRCNVGGGTKFAIADNAELYTVDGRGMLLFTYFDLS
jgi:hypothetical protein